MAKNNTNKIFSQETAEQHGFKPAYALNDGTGREVWVRENGMNKQSIYVKPSPQMTTLSDYAFEKPNGEREYIGPKGKIPMFEEDIKRMVEESVKRILKETMEADYKKYYMLLSRLQQDCNYYLGHGGRDAKHALWAHDEQEQIDKMRELYNMLPEKPEWITLEDIDNYAREMGVQ